MQSHAQDLDHFTCYKAGATSGSVKFRGLMVSLDDRFGPSPVEVKKPKFLCAPTDKNDEDPTAPQDPGHLEGHQIKSSIKFNPRTNIGLTNQFGRLVVDATKPSHLLVPTAKNLAAPPPQPNFFLDHFQCYKVKTSKNTPKFSPIRGVKIRD